MILIYCFSLGKNIFGEDAFQNIVNHHLIRWSYKKTRALENVIGWKLKKVYTSKLTLLYTVFLHYTKRSGYKIEIQFNKSVLVVEQKNYGANIVNVYIVYDLDDWPRNPLNRFSLENYLFGAVILLKIVMKGSACLVAIE